jgi:hypothetical protein
MDQISTQTFSGTPARYKKLCIFGSILIHAYLYGGYAAIQYLVNGDTTALNWGPALVAVASTLFVAVQGYRWIMRLDAQYGRGSSWNLTSTMVKLPELKHRPKKR